MNRARISTFIALLAALTACSTTSLRPTPAEMNDALLSITEQNGRACVRVADIAGFGDLSDNLISVSNRFRNHYLMVTAYNCFNMASTPAAAFQGAFTEFCGGGRDSIFTREGRCLVRSVFEFENREAAFEAHNEALEHIEAQRKAAES